MVVRRETIASAGNLDEDFFMYGEDEEWCSRIKRAGWRIVYFPGTTIIHRHRFSSRQARRAPGVNECLSAVLVLHKRRGRRSLDRQSHPSAGMIPRLPFWLLFDALAVLQGTPQKGLFRSRLVVLLAHLKGIVSPVWVPRIQKRQ